MPQKKVTITLSLPEADHLLKAVENQQYLYELNTGVSVRQLTASKKKIEAAIKEARGGGESTEQ